MKEVGIIATVGPASFSGKVLLALNKSGANVFRVNTKYGNEKEWSKTIDSLNKIKAKIMVDIKTEKTIPWLKEQKVDYVAISFAEKPDHINNIRKMLPKSFKLISKIESAKAIKNLDPLIKVSDGIMVARGDLGKNIPLEQVPIFQKIIIRKCNKRNKLVITATEMLLSMTKSKIPERAEVSDIANAVIDGSDFLMLSEETAIGKYPELAVSEMKKIIDSTQSKMHLLR